MDLQRSLLAMIFADFFNISQIWKNRNFCSNKYAMHLVRGWTMAKSYLSHLRSKLPTASFSTLLEWSYIFFSVGSCGNLWENWHPWHRWGGETMELRNSVSQRIWPILARSFIASSNFPTKRACCLCFWCEKSKNSSFRHLCVFTIFHLFLVAACKGAVLRRNWHLQSLLPWLSKRFKCVLAG